MTNIEVVLRALNLKLGRPRGSRAWALCPFHETDVYTAFFVRISGEHAGTFHCYSCKASGSLSKLVMHVQSCDYKTAKEFIRRAGKGFEAPRARVRVLARPPALMRARFELPRECIVDRPLKDWLGPAEEYARSRGITDDEVERYGLGYAVDGRLAGRLIFPVRVAPRARAVGYSARTWAGEEPKYKTPDEREEADLDAIFGEHLWPVDLRERKLIAITEGAVDALAVGRATGLLVGSMSGSDVRPGHVIKLATFEIVVVLTDPDAPGEKAAQGYASSLGRHVRVVRPLLPEGNDAASMQPARLSATIDLALERAS